MDSSPWPGPLASLWALRPAMPTQHGFTGTDGWRLIALLTVLVIAALASASETALTSVPRIRIRNKSAGGDERAQLIERLLREPNTFLTTILIINSVALIVASTLSALIALDVFANWAEVISTVLISLVVLIFCEITPKTAAVQNSERWARALVRPVYYASLALGPLVSALTLITGGLVRTFGGQPRVRGPFVTEEELRLLIEVGEQEGVLEESERDIIHNVFELSETTVREVMVPRIDMVTIEASASVDSAVNLILQGGQSRIPVYSGSIDNIIGVLYAKDLLRELASRQCSSTVGALVRPAYFVPETKRADDLLRELKQQRVHMAIVTDEYGQVAGLVTIEDLVEEIIGDIQDEYDREEVLYEKLSPDEYIVDAKISIDDFNELVDAHLASEDYDTLAGLVYSQLDKIPSIGNMVEADGLRFTVLATKGRRVTKVKVVRVHPDALPPAGEQEARKQLPASTGTPPAKPAQTPDPAVSSAPALPPPAAEPEPVSEAADDTTRSVEVTEEHRPVTAHDPVTGDQLPHNAGTPPPASPPPQRAAADRAHSDPAADIRPRATRSRALKATYNHGSSQMRRRGA